MKKSPDFEISDFLNFWIGAGRYIGKGSMALNLIMSFSNSHTSCREGIDGVEADNVG